MSKPAREQIEEWIKRMKQDRVDDKELAKIEDAPAGDGALVAKLADVYIATAHLIGAIEAMREFSNHRAPGEDFGLRLLDCGLWAQNLACLLTQMQIIAKGEER